MLQFAVEMECLDQTALQAVTLLDTYLRNNPQIQPGFLRVISAVALQISVKINETMEFSLEEIEESFDREFPIKMLVRLELHILQLNKFRTNLPTPLDYVLHFVFLQLDDFIENEITLSPEEIVTLSLPILHYSICQYDISRKNYVSIAIAAISYVLQEAQQQIVYNSSIIEANNGIKGQFKSMLRFRDIFLKNLFTRFKNTFDLEEIWSIVQHLNNQAIKRHAYNVDIVNQIESSSSLSDSELFCEEQPEV